MECLLIKRCSACCRDTFLQQNDRWPLGKLKRVQERVQSSASAQSSPVHFVGILGPVSPQSNERMHNSTCNNLPERRVFQCMCLRHSNSAMWPEKKSKSVHMRIQAAVIWSRQIYGRELKTNAFQNRHGRFSLASSRRAESFSELCVQGQ